MVDISAHCSIVVIPLCLRNSAISVLVTKTTQKLSEHLILSHLTAPHLGVLIARENSFQISATDHTITIPVELEVGLVNEGLSLSIWYSSDTLEELIKVDEAIIVSVQVVQQ